MLETAHARPAFQAATAIPVHDRHRRSLRRAVEALVLVHPRVQRLPDDGTLEELAVELGIAPDDFVALNVLLGRRRFSIVCPSNACWQKGKAVFFEMKAAAAATGRSVVLVPERFIRREPRLTNSVMIAEAVDSHIGLTDRMSILVHLLEHGGSAPLSDLAGLVRGPDPVSAVMRLIVEGGLYMDLDQRILPHSNVFLVQP